MNPNNPARLALLGLAACLGACVGQPVTTAPAYPQNLQVPAGQVLVLKVQGVGAQVYECRAAADDASHLAWVLKAPEARLVDEQGAAIGRHFAGPTWEVADGSRVVGEVKAKADSPDGKSIPWLLLAAKVNTGSGLLAKVASVQRLNTQGGLAPTEGCDAAHAGTEQKVPYQAEYDFYAAGS